METRKLYYEDSFLKSFHGRVLSCEEQDHKYYVTLDQTAFYPEGGGQAGDTGCLGGVRVLDTQEKGTQVIHICEGPLEVGTEAEGTIDWEPRFYRMQQHSGEHIVSGILHRIYGCHNVGFHMGADVTTIDFDAVIPQEKLREVELEANEAVYADIPFHIWIPSPEELPGVNYRTKRALSWPVRIVEIPGYDTCACCGTHVKTTGTIGLIKIFSAVPFRGGTRIEMACGKRALEILNSAYDQNKQVSQAFSAKMEETGEAARRMNEILEADKFKLTGLQMKIWDFTAKDYEGVGNCLCFQKDLDGMGLRELCERITAVCGGMAAVFSGSDGEGYGYCLGTAEGDLRAFNKEMNLALHGRGGGKPLFQQGRVQASGEEISQFFREKTENIKE